MRILLALAIAAGAVSCDRIPGTAEHRIAEARQVVAGHMRDPSSVQFRAIREVKLDNDSLAYCGEINGQNAMGGYAGFQRFVLYRGDQVLIDPSREAVPSLEVATARLGFEALNLQVCVNRQANPSPLT